MGVVSDDGAGADGDVVAELDVRADDGGGMNASDGQSGLEELAGAGEPEAGLRCLNDALGGWAGSGEAGTKHDHTCVAREGFCGGAGVFGEDNVRNAGLGGRADAAQAMVGAALD